MTGSDSADAADAAASQPVSTSGVARPASTPISAQRADGRRERFAVATAWTRRCAVARRASPSLAMTAHSRGRRRRDKIVAEIEREPARRAQHPDLGSRR